jgi:hypothetical protein
MKNTIKKLAPVMLVLVALATLSFTTNDGVLLRLRPEQDKTYTITSKANMTMKMEIQGMSMNQKQNLEIRQSFIAKEVNDNESIIETQIEAIKMTANQMGMKFEYDSEHPEKTSRLMAEQAKEFEKVLNKPESIKYDLLGNIIDTLNIEISQLGAVINELPEEEINVGSTWTFNKAKDLTGNEINVNYTYTVTAISKKSVDISITGTVAADASQTSGSYEGTASINPQTGLVMNSSITTNVSMTMTEQGMTFPVTMIGTTTVEVK